MRALLPLLVGCAGVAASPPPSAPADHVLGEPLVVAGEAMVYDVAFRGLPAGRVQVAIGKPGWIGDRPAIVVKSRGETHGLLALIGDLEWAAASTIDLERGTVLAATEDSRVELAGATETEHRDHAAGSHTIHSAAAALRGWRSSAGQKTALLVRILDGRLRVALHEAAREAVRGSQDETKPAVRYDGIANDRFAFKVWISDDAARVPLRLDTATKWGHVTVELAEYTAPRD